MNDLLKELQDRVQSQGHTAQSDVHTLKVETPNSTHHIKRCGECGEAYSHKHETRHCPTCGCEIFKGHHH